MGGVGAEPVVGAKMGEHHRPDVPQGERFGAGADRQLERQFLEQPVSARSRRRTASGSGPSGVWIVATNAITSDSVSRSDGAPIRAVSMAVPSIGLQGGVVEAGPFQDLVDQRAEAGTAGQVGHGQRQRRSRRLVVGDVDLVGAHHLVGDVCRSRQRVLGGQRAERDPAPLVVEMAGESRPVQGDRLSADRLVCVDRRRLTEHRQCDGALARHREERRVAPAGGDQTGRARSPTLSGRLSSHHTTRWCSARVRAT